LTNEIDDFRFPISDFRFCYADVMRALGIDYGKRRIGLAVSDATGLLARPWKTIAHGGTLRQVVRSLGDEIATLQGEDGGLAAVVLGLPRRLSGEPNALTEEVQKLYTILVNEVTIPVVLQDERLSSYEAESALAQRVKDWRKRKPLLDAASAAVILQDYLDGLSWGVSTHEPPDGEDR
jgi:putative holliday junction resolvase